MGSRGILKGLMRFLGLAKRRRAKTGLGDCLDEAHAVRYGEAGGRRFAVMRQCPVQKESVLSVETKDAEDVVRQVRKELCETGAFQPWNLSISGFDMDPRGLFEIPEVRKWCKAAFERSPHLLCMLSPDSVNWYLPCLLDLEIGKREGRGLGGSVEVRVKDPSQADRILSEALAAGREFFAACVSDMDRAVTLFDEARERLTG